MLVHRKSLFVIRRNHSILKMTISFHPKGLFKQCHRHSGCNCTFEVLKNVRTLNVTFVAKNPWLNVLQKCCWSSNIFAELSADKNYLLIIKSKDISCTLILVPSYSNCLLFYIIIPLKSLSGSVRNFCNVRFIEL